MSYVITYMQCRNHWGMFKLEIGLKLFVTYQGITACGLGDIPTSDADRPSIDVALL